MNLDCSNKRVIVTAAASGIGNAIAETFLENGARLHICDVDGDRLEECRKKWPEVGTTVADVSDPEQVDILFDEAQKHLGGLDVLVNNAGIAGPTAPVEEVEPEAWKPRACLPTGLYWWARLDRRLANKRFDGMKRMA